MSLLRNLQSYISRHRNDVAGMPLLAGTLEGLRPTDQFLVSYPRSGNTWLRYLVRDVIVLQRPDLPPPAEGGLADPGTFIPDIHAHPMDHPAHAAYGVQHRIAKSHNIRDLEGRKMVYIFRKPADALVSYFHYIMRLQPDDRLLAGGVDAFCQEMLPTWCEHVETALRFQRAAPDKTHIVSYEMMVEDTKGELQRIVDFLGLSAPSTILDTVVEKNSFERLRAKEAVRPRNPKEFFFRKGKIGGGEEELRPETSAFLRNKDEKVYESATAVAHAARQSHS